MARGKYAAKAANRMANLDNDLLQQARTEVNNLKRQLSEAEDRLLSECRERDALALARAEELAAQQIALARSEVADLTRRHDALNRATADRIVELMQSLERSTPDLLMERELIQVLIPKIFAELVGGGNIGQYISRLFSVMDKNRVNRRKSLRDLNFAIDTQGRREESRKTQMLSKLEKALAAKDVDDE